MIQLKYRYQQCIAYPEDVNRMIKILHDNGYSASARDCDRAWSKYSDDYCAGWLRLGSDEEVLDVLMDNLEEA